MTVLHLPVPPFPYFLECGHTVYRPGEQHPNRRHIGLFDLIAVETGCLHIGEEERAWDIAAGQTIILLPDRYHYAVRPCGERTAFYWIHFRTACEWAERSEPQLSVDADAHASRYGAQPYVIELPKQSSMRDREQTFGLLRRLLELSAAPRSGAVWQQQQLFEALLRLFDLRQNEHGRGHAVALAERTEAYIKSNFRSPISAGAMAEALHFHYNYIARCMKRVYGLSPMEYLLHYRLEQAKTLLLKTDRPIADIAQEVGFDSVPYFSRCFSSRIGIPPLRFRKRFSE